MLFHLEPVLVQAAGCDAFEAQAGNAVHVGRQQDAVPVDRSVFTQAVAHAQGDRVAFPPAQDRPGERAVDGHCGAGGTGEVHRSFADEQVEFAAGQYGGLTGAGQRPDRCAP
ncbi:hypothetical protein D9M70_444690 [compost metagenome]